MTHQPRTTQRKTTSSFATSQGAEECFLCIGSDRGLPFAEALQQVHARYHEALTQHALSTDTQIFTRVYLSDIENQKEALQRSSLYEQLILSAVTAIGQAPVVGGPVALLSYHIKSSDTPWKKARLSPVNASGRNDWLMSGRDYSMLWNAQCEAESLPDPQPQSTAILSSIADTLSARGMTLPANTIRSWIYVRDIDNNYMGMVKARRDFFASNGLTDKTRYLASTGIEGKLWASRSLVGMDILSMGGLQADQILRMEALDHMPPTITYGVTFERGLRVRFGDRSHLHVSGTASIDKNGTVLHPGDVAQQTMVTLRNVRALLQGHKAGLSDLTHMLVYVRDVHAVETVAGIINTEVPTSVPAIILHAPVCRPSWLVEMEGIAILRDSSGFAPFR